MRLSGMVCPHCGGALGNIEEGRTQLFCTYCGSKLSLEIDNEEVKKITEFKNAEANLNYSKANYAEQRARQLEAETHKIMYRDSSNHIYSSKIAG